MPDSTETSLEEASRCPRCQFPCKQVAVRQLPDGQGQARTFQCENERCDDFGGRRLVQTNPDGSIPQGHTGPKAFARLPGHSMRSQQARDELAIIDWMSTHPNASRQDAIRALGG